MNTAIFKIERFIATTDEIFKISKDTILDSYPPYSLDLYNYYEKRAESQFVPPFVHQSGSILIEPLIKYNFTKINIPDTKEYNFINSTGTIKCDVFNTSLDYDLDLEKINDNNISINYNLYTLIDSYSPAISGIWRPALIYIDPMDEASRNTSVSYSASSKDTPYEAGLCLENFITVNNPVFKSWELSGTKFMVDWKIPKTSFMTAATMGILFWYRHYDIDRETNLLFSSPTIPKETRTESYYGSATIAVDDVDVVLQHIHSDYNYTPDKAPIDPRTTQEYDPLLSRYGTQGGYYVGQKVALLYNPGTPNEKTMIYEVTDQHWICLGERRFLPGVDIYIPDEQLYMQWISSIDLKDYKNCCAASSSNTAMTEISSSPSKLQYATIAVNNQNKYRYRAVLNSLLSLTDDNILEQIYDKRKPFSDVDGNYDFDAVNKYLAIKNLAKILANSPIQEGVSVYAYAAKDTLRQILSFLDFRPRGSSVGADLREQIKNIYGRLVSIRSDLVSFAAQTVSEDDIPIDEELKIIYSSPSFDPNILSNKTKALSYSMSATTEYKSFNESNLVRTKKDLLRALIKFKDNRYILFPAGQESYIESKFTIDKPHLYFNLDFEDQKKLYTLQNLWYKQKIRAMGLELYTKLRLPDDSEFTGSNEYESLELSYYNTNEEKKYKLNIPILDLLDMDTSNGYYNQALGHLYNEYGITGQFNQKNYIERALLSNASLNGEYFDLGKGLRVTKDRYYMENQTFNNALRTYAFGIEELFKNNIIAQRAKGLLDDRFRNISVSTKSIYPNIRKFYLHRLGGMYLQDIGLFTIGQSTWANLKTGPVPITNAQYFLDQSITSELAFRTADVDKKIKITFNCSQDLSIKLYGLTIEKLRDEKYTLATCRPFPSKVPIRSDPIYVYDKVLGYEFNEAKHILSTQFSPPIVAYGGHRQESIEALGVNIFDHPKPIASGVWNEVTLPAISGMVTYDVKNENILPVAAKNSRYSYENTQDQKNALGLLEGSATTWNYDLSAVKCFLTPQNFTNEVTFRKGFFHPNKGWIDYTLLTDTDSKYVNKTAVQYLEDRPCEEFLGYGNSIIEGSMTRYEDKAKSNCSNTGAAYVEGDENLVVREPLMIFNKSERVNLQQPNYLTVKMESAVRRFDFITHLSVRLYDFFHDYPKEIKVALFDPLFYRWMSWGIVDTQIARIIAALKCLSKTNPEQIEKYKKNRIKEKNNLLGQWQYKVRTLARYLLSKSTMLNYEDGFDIKFSSYGKKTAKYAANLDTVIPVQSLDYFIGSSGTLSGFWEYAELSGDDNVSSDPDAPPDPNATPPTGNDTKEYESTWGIHVSDMGVGDSGATCFALQACTGCPIPNYSNTDPYSMFAYNNETFDIPYRSGYNFIANFRNKLHLIPPVNIEAPLSIYDNREFTDINGFKLSCIAQPDTIRPREFPKPPPSLEPIFMPPIFPSLVGLLTHLSNMAVLTELGYNPLLGATAGVWVQNSDLMQWFDPSLINQPYTNAFDNASSVGLTRNERIRRSWSNKGFIQIEGATAEALKMNSGMNGITNEDSPLASLISSQQTLNINKKYPEGRPSKVLLEVQYNNCLWYNIEADIFRYSPKSSPVLNNKKFHYLKHNELLTYPTSEPYEADKFYEQLAYPGLLLNIKNINPQNPYILYIDGARAYYALQNNETIKIKYRTAFGSSKTSGATSCDEVPPQPDVPFQTKTMNSTIKKIEIIYVDNPMHIPSITPSDSNNLDDISEMEEADAILDVPDYKYTSNPKIEYGDNPKFIKYPMTKITLTTPISIAFKNETFIEGYISKLKTNSFLLFDNILSDGVVYKHRNICDSTEMTLLDDSISVSPSLGGCLYTQYKNIQDLIKSGRWFDIKDRHTESLVSPYIYDQTYSEGGLGWGSKKIIPKEIGVDPPSELLQLRDFDYHFGVNNFCGLVKFTKGYLDGNTKIGRIKFEPRITGSGLVGNPYAQKTENANETPFVSASLSGNLYDYISYTGYPKPLDSIKNKIFAHNLFSITDGSLSLYDQIFGSGKIDKFIYNKTLLEYYLPYYDLTVSNTLLDEELLASNPIPEGTYSAASGWVELENIMKINKRVVYDNNYYWISIPESASGVLSPSSKIPKAIIQKCSHLDGSYSTSFCSNVCNASLVGPSWPNQMDEPYPENINSQSLVYKFDPSDKFIKCPGVEYETRTTEQSFYMGCGESGNQDNTRVDVTQVYEVPSAASTFISAKDLFQNISEIKVKFQYFPKKIPTDFTFSLGKNVVNQSQLYFWECHKTNKRNVYDQSTRSQTPPFYQILNEMIFRAWFGERQKISIPDTFDRDIYLSQNHYQWIPYDYDDTNIFDRERKII